MVALGNWLPLSTLAEAVLLSLIEEESGTMGKTSTSSVDYGGTAPLVYYLSLTVFIKAPAGK